MRIPALLVLALAGFCRANHRANVSSSMRSTTPTKNLEMEFQMYRSRWGRLQTMVLFGIPPNEPRTGVDGSNFLDGRKPRCEVSMASASQTVRTALEGLIWRFSLT